MTITSTLRGVNLVGGEFNWASNIVPKEGQNYLFVSDTDITYLVGKGMKFARLVFSWELLQPTLKGPLVTTPGSYGATLLSRVAKLRSLNVHVMIEPHSADTSKSAKYKGMLVGSVGCPNDAFSDLWMKISSLFVNDPYGFRRSLFRGGSQ
jgi:aryl-phospho-beta-D-glucosidase BglC (GH1 family)